MFEPKEWVNGLGPGAGQRWPKFPKHALFVTSPPENPTETEKIIFSILTKRLAESVEGLNSSLAQSPGELWSCKNVKSRVKKVARAGLKGFASHLSLVLEKHNSIETRGGSRQ